MKSEMQYVNENLTWILEKLPKGKISISCKWVYEIKTTPDSFSEKYKARVVIKGYSQ